MHRSRFGSHARKMLGAAILAALSAVCASAATSDLPRLYTNEAMVEDAMRKSSLAIGDPMTVFAFVLGGLPERVTVYPTENYYYFYFYHNSVRYAGNIRLDVMDRDAGKLHFAYFKDFTEWSGEPEVNYRVLDQSHGVKVEKLDQLVYRVSHGGKSVVFTLNDLSKVVPPARAIGPDEKYLGPVFDESTIRFFLVYNRRLKIFHYILDETATVADELFPAMSSDRILIGRRTGFAFYRDHKLDRKILIGVFEGNSRSNNYFDGPFDQLPDNFIEGETLREAILEVEPDLAGQIDRLGSSPDGANRFMIGPYLHYRSEEELDLFHQCATSKEVPADEYYNCFVIDEDAPDESGAEPAPAAPAQKKSGKKKAERPVQQR